MSFRVLFSNWSNHAKDGPIAGQSVPHVHVHILPRKADDLPHNDDIYGQIDESSVSMMHDWNEALRHRASFTAVDDEDRKPRTMAQMEEEATWLRSLF